MLLGSPVALNTPALDPDFATQCEKILELRRLAQNPPQDEQITRHRERGKLLARERVTQLLDADSPAIEIATLAGLNLYGGDVRAGAGLITIIGKIQGRWSVVVANDATVKGGSYFPMTVKKHLRAQEIAFENRLPCFYLVDSGGAFLPMQSDVFPDREHFGRIFYNQARLSAAGIPQIAVVMGSCTAGGAYVPAMCDETIIVRDQGTIFLGGPPLVKAATGEEVSAEDLGGGVVHTEKSGVADHLADDDYHAISIARDIARYRPHQAARVLGPRIAPLTPGYKIEELYNLVSVSPRKPFPMREVLARILDGSELHEFKARYGETLICGTGHIDGWPVGIVANDGILFSESARKGAHFIELCDQRGIPLLFLQNISGFMVGKQYEHTGIARDGAKLVTAVSCARVPKITVVVGGSFGAGNYGMAGRAYQPRFMFMWPTARISVMGPEQAASVLTQIRADSYKARGKPIDDKELLSYRAEIESRYQNEAAATYATARLWDDGIIAPDETRAVVSTCLNITASAPLPESRFGVFRM